LILTTLKVKTQFTETLEKSRLNLPENLYSWSTFTFTVITEHYIMTFGVVFLFSTCII